MVYTLTYRQKEGQRGYQGDISLIFNLILGPRAIFQIYDSFFDSFYDTSVPFQKVRRLLTKGAFLWKYVNTIGIALQEHTSNTAIIKKIFKYLKMCEQLRKALI